MRRVGPVVLIALALVACKKKREAPAATPPPAVATVDAAAAPAPPPDLSFISGDVVVIETAGGQTRPSRLDPATGAWSTLGSGDAKLFPTGHRLRGGLLVIATWGDTEADHREQLAIVRGPAVETFGPTAAMVRNPRVTPDGTTVIAETSEHSYRDLYAIGPDGKATRLTDNEQGNFEPALSPDGKLVAFASSRDGDAELYVQPLAGAVATRLTDSRRDDWNPTWSRDGKTLVFLSDRDGQQRLFTMPAGGGPAVRLTSETAEDAIEELPRWSPDGRTLAFVRGQGTELSVILRDMATGASRTITPAGKADLDFAWSPDGQHLAILRNPDQKPRSQTEITFVRVSDGTSVATADLDATTVLWLAP